MILGGLLAVCLFLIEAMLSLFPTYSPPVQTPAWAALSAANIVLPLDVWAACMGVTLSVMSAAGVVWVVKTVFNAIRGSGA